MYFVIDLRINSTTPVPIWNINGAFYTGLLDTPIQNVPGKNQTLLWQDKQALVTIDLVINLCQILFPLIATSPVNVQLLSKHSTVTVRISTL